MDKKYVATEMDRFLAIAMMNSSRWYMVEHDEVSRFVTIAKEYHEQTDQWPSLSEFNPGYYMISECIQRSFRFEDKLPPTRDSEYWEAKRNMLMAMDRALLSDIFHNTDDVLAFITEHCSYRDDYEISIQHNRIDSIQFKDVITQMMWKIWATGRVE